MIEVQQYYWENCYSFVGGIESYLLNCPNGISNENSSKVVETIIHQLDLKPHLTEWASTIVSIPSNFETQNADAQLTITLIDAELEHR